MTMRCMPVDLLIPMKADRDEIMWYGTSNRNESINNVYAVKASKAVDFRYYRPSQSFFVYYLV